MNMLFLLISRPPPSNCLDKSVSWLLRHVCLHLSCLPHPPFSPSHSLSLTLLPHTFPPSRSSLLPHTYLPHTLPAFPHTYLSHSPSLPDAFSGVMGYEYCHRHITNIIHCTVLVHHITADPYKDCMVRVLLGQLGHTSWGVILIAAKANGSTQDSWFRKAHNGTNSFHPL